MAALQSSGAELNWHVTIKLGGSSGSPEHFHHFLLGFFVPLVYHLSTDWRQARFDRLIVRSCGPFDRIIRELGDDRIEIIDKDQHRQIAQPVPDRHPMLADAAPNHGQLQFVTIDGCDYPVTYDAAKFSTVRDVLLSREATRSATGALAERWNNGRPRILLIERGVSLPYYHSDQAEKKYSGQDRRSIANHAELYRSLRLEYPDCLNVRTEALTLADQVALFSLADIVIAQHGAALANMIWARPNATVIEILPAKANHMFSFLSFCTGLRYRKVGQPDEHGAVDIDEILKAVANAIALPPTRLATTLRASAFKMLRPVLLINRALRRQFFRARDRASRARGRLVAPKNLARSPR